MADYRKRKEEALALEGKQGKGGDAKPTGKGDQQDKGKGQPHPKGKGKGKDGGRGKAGKRGKSNGRGKHVRTIRVNVANNETSGSGDAFPAGGAGLDSWANVWLRHVTDPATEWTESVTLADGTAAPCYTAVGPKGIPVAQMQAKPDGESIDLLPWNWFVDRGCYVAWGDKVLFHTPKGRILELPLWCDMPYLTKEQIQLVLGDLPPSWCPGRSGLKAGQHIKAAFVRCRICAARVTYAVPLEEVRLVAPEPTSVGGMATPAPPSGGGDKSAPLLPQPVATGKVESRQSIRRRLSHVRGLSKKEKEKWVDKYKCMPDYYMDGKDGVCPEDLVDNDKMSTYGYTRGQPVGLWEFFAGSGKLSALGRAREVPHLPPVDYRWGYDVRTLKHQLYILYAYLVYGCWVLFASPNCTPWGNNARQWSADSRRERRRAEGLSLQFMTMLCFFRFFRTGHI